MGNTDHPKPAYRRAAFNIRSLMIDNLALDFGVVFVDAATQWRDYLFHDLGVSKSLGCEFCEATFSRMCIAQAYCKTILRAHVFGRGNEALSTSFAVSFRHA